MGCDKAPDVNTSMTISPYYSEGMAVRTTGGMLYRVATAVLLDGKGHQASLSQVTLQSCQITHAGIIGSYGG